MSNEDKKRILATNRLLEILRSEQSSDDKRSEEEESVPDKLSVESEEGSEVSSEVQTDEKIIEPDDDESLLNKFAWLKPSEESIRAEDEVKNESVESPKEDVQEQSPGLSNEIEDDLLLKTDVDRKFATSVEPEIVLPPEFNESLISKYEGRIAKSNWQKWFKFLKRYFADNRRKISINFDNNTIYLLQTVATINETIIEQAKSFSLPYEYEGQLFTHKDDLLSHVLENEISEKSKKFSYGAYFSPDLPSKTISVKSPKLKKKERGELIEWHANKNLTFSVENKNVNWEIQKSDKDSETEDIIIGVTENKSINEIAKVFNENKIDFRFTTTLPILLWKSFVKNYPDRNSGSYVIIHIGETRTLVIVVTDHVLEFSRKIALGAQDFYKAIIKNVDVDESGQKIDNAIAKGILCDYGYPEKMKGLTANYNVDLNKVTVAIRPVVERVISELNRTLNYFKTQKTELDWKALLFDGIAASFPGLLETIEENIYQKVELLNPVRVGKYNFNSADDLLPNQYPKYLLNFALAADEVENFNISPKKIQEDYKYSFYNKNLAAIMAILIPLFLFTGIFSNLSLKNRQRSLTEKRSELSRLSADTKDYANFVGDLKIINDTEKYLKNDRLYSENQLKTIKLFSTIVPKEVKLTNLDYVNEIGIPDTILAKGDFREHLEVAGFVDNNKSVADIYLTDFILQLEQINEIVDVQTVDKHVSNFDRKDVLLFKLYIELK